MTLRPASMPSVRRPVAIALAALAAGVAYYAVFRAAAPPPWPDPTHGTFPSLVHGFATALLLIRVAGTRGRAALLVGANVALTATLEGTLGTFDPLDLAALGAGTLAALALGRDLPTSAPAWPWRRALVPGLLTASTLMTVATAPDDGGVGTPVSEDDGGEPVYLTYNALRQAVRTVEPRPLEAIGRVYLYEDFLLLNARNEGVHVIDNSDPAAPVPLSFIEIPGNTELAIRDGILFADSYVDLVAIDLASFGGAPREVARQPDVFPWDPYQNVPDGTYFRGYPDEALGVVTGVEDDR